MRKQRIQIPPIKSQGIKSKLVPYIKDVIPEDFNGRWIEPFMGSGVVAFNVRPQKAILADSNPHLINFYQSIMKEKITPSITRQYLEHEGAELLRTEGEYYYVVRDRFNRNGNPLDFLFLNRADFNGMIRFNQKGEFNVPFCRKPNRFSQAYITKICNQIRAVHEIFQSIDYEFKCQDYETTIKEANSSDILYCDPPYIARHTDYFNNWGENNEMKMAELLFNTDARFILSTWHSNRYRKNEFINSIWSQYNILTIQHYYFIGGKEVNRNPMLEALVLNFNSHFEIEPQNLSQLALFEK